MTERITFQNDRGQKIAGVIHRAGEGSPGIVMVHGFTGDKDEGGLFVSIAKSLNDLGFTVLRFDCAGSGDSEGKFKNMTRRREADDLRAAVEFIKKQNTNKEKIGVVGFSLGAAVSVLAYEPEIKTMVLLSPVLGGDIFWNWYKNSEYFTEESGGKIYFTWDDDSEVYGVNRELLEESRNMNFREKAKKVNVPVLIIHGSEDKTIETKYPKNAVGWFPDAKLEIIEGSGHNYEDPRYEETLVENISTWLQENL